VLDSPTYCLVTIYTKKTQFSRDYRRGTIWWICHCTYFSHWETVIIRTMINIRLLVKSFHYAVEGIVLALEENQNLRIHFIVAVLVMIASIIFDISRYEMGILGVMILLVISAEMINTTIETMVDLITNEHRKEAKIAKDVAAGMVLVNALGSVIVGLIIFIPHIFTFFHIKI
jgi:diacylglycerol kinase (ATP)